MGAKDELLERETKANATPLRPAPTARTVTEQETLRPPATNPAQATARTPQSDQSQPAKLCAPGHVNPKDPTPSDQERTAEATDQKTPQQSTNDHQRHARTAPKRAATRATRRVPGTTEPKTMTPATHRQRDRQRTEDRHRRRNRTAHPSPEQTTRRAQETRGNRGSRRYRMKRQATPPPTDPTGMKTSTQQKGRKNRDKTDGSWRQAIEGRKVARPEITDQ